tara:strand:- start:5776 stop:6234 length:459 start_codon:yes stop_codon:yes gene_type:complete
MSELKEGSVAPDFHGLDQNDQNISLSQFNDKKLILYFYPKDNTPGCTKESCNLRDNYTDLLNMGYSIVGVSADSAAKHQNFIAKYDLPFPLIADVNKEIIKSYGCWGLKKFMGREYEGILRKTFVIENNIIVKMFNKVKTNDHAKQILEAMN